uniref:Uncharacterized protein n=1 Tax=Globodera rostochiensis TaxID=31243 RepID=A0A914GUI1_GLORO
MDGQRKQQLMRAEPPKFIYSSCGILEGASLVDNFHAVRGVTNPSSLRLNALASKVGGFHVLMLGNTPYVPMFTMSRAAGVVGRGMYNT